MAGNLMNGADVWVIERGRGASFTPEALQALRIGGNVGGQEFQRHETVNESRGADETGVLPAGSRQF